MPCYWRNRETIATLSPAVKFDRGAECYPPARMLIDQWRGGGVGERRSPGQHADEHCAGVPCDEHDGRGSNRGRPPSMGRTPWGGRQSVGSIEAGKSADLAILGVPDYRELPYHLGVNLVNLVMIRGAVRVERPEVKWPAR